MHLLTGREAGYAVDLSLWIEHDTSRSLIDQLYDMKLMHGSSRGYAVQVIYFCPCWTPPTFTPARNEIIFSSYFASGVPIGRLSYESWLEPD